MRAVYLWILYHFIITVQKEKLKKCINSDKLIDNKPVKTKKSRKKTIKKRKAHGNSGLCGVNTIYTA